MFSVFVIKTSDYDRLEINGHPGAGSSFLNLIFIYGKCTISYIEITHTLLCNFLQRLNCKDVPVHTMKAYRGVKVLLILNLELEGEAWPCP